ncbi:MAG: hypothetical protein JO132_05945 [Streptosporangiaceae bacterium]|nr:hypothetical protein [Streptosporangiaceae bacterium]
MNDEDEAWLSDLETRVLDLESKMSDRARPRERVPAGHGTGRRSRGTASRGQQAASRRGARSAAYLDFGDGDLDDVSSSVHGVPVPPAGFAPVSGGLRPGGGADRTQRLISHGRRGVGRDRRKRRKVVVAVAAAAAMVSLIVAIAVQSGPSWPSSVAQVQGEIGTACQSANLASEPNQVNFACAKATSQVLWVFSLLASEDNAGFTDPKTGRRGLEPITPTLGGAVAWSLNLHHPYDPYSAIDSLQVAARAINNIIGGATLTSANGSPVVQPGLESNPANCARYTGSSDVTARAGYPAVCARPVTSGAGQAALVSDVFRTWFTGTSPSDAKDAGVLFQYSADPGDPQVQAILKKLSPQG